MEFDHRTRLARTSNAATTDSTLAPGKRTLTEQLVVQRRESATPPGGESGTNATVPSTPAPLPTAASSRSLSTLQMLFGPRPAPAEATLVQRLTDGGSIGDVHAAAKRAISTGDTRLPFLDSIQKAFGRYDVSNVKAHLDETAAEATREMGAHAFASGEHVAFARTPDLHTAAHEAAHVVQQRAGVSLASGVGQVGDAHERHADEVADLVVSGQSAEGVLDRVAGPAAVHPGSATGAVQLLTDEQIAQLREYINDQEIQVGYSPQVSQVDAQIEILKQNHKGEKPRDLQNAKAQALIWLQGLKQQQDLAFAAAPKPGPVETKKPQAAKPTAAEKKQKGQEKKKKKHDKQEAKELEQQQLMAQVEAEANSAPLPSYLAVSSQYLPPVEKKVTAPENPVFQGVLDRLYGWSPVKHDGCSGTQLSKTEIQQIADEHKNLANYYCIKGEGSGAYTNKYQLKIIHRVQMDGGKHCTFHITLTPKQYEDVNTTEG